MGKTIRDDEIRRLLEERMTLLNLTLEEVGVYVGVSHPTVIKWLDDGMLDIRLPLASVRPLARLLGLDADKLCCIAEEV